MKVQTVIAATALTLSAAALANEGQEVTFSTLDADRNGVIDQQESQAHAPLAERFENADHDQDGQLSQSEFSFAMAQIRAETDPRQQS